MPNIPKQTPLRDSFYFAEERFDTDYWMPPHLHEDLSSFAFCVHGVVQEFCEGKTLSLQMGSLTYMPMGVTHANRFPGETRLFLLLLRPEWFARFPEVQTRIERPVVCLTGLPTVIARRMYSESMRRDDLTMLAMEGMLLELIAAMLRSTAPQKEDHPPRWLRQTVDFLHARFAENLSLEALAAQADVHPNHLIRTFRRFYHCTIGDYLRTLRVEYACHLLLSTRTPLAELALLAGFSDQSHFCHAFKRLKGVSPTAFRNQQPPQPLFLGC